MGRGCRHRNQKLVVKVKNRKLLSFDLQHKRKNETLPADKVKPLCYKKVSQSDFNLLTKRNARYCQKFYEKKRRYGTTEFTEKFSVVSML
jgi:hypothetical protein